MKVLIDRIRAVIAKSHWWAEAASAVVIMTWGVFNAIDPTDLAKVDSYQLVTRLLPEWSLELLAVVVGIGQLSGLLVDKPLPRLAGAFAACFTYSLFVIGFLASHAIPPGTVFVAGWVAVNVLAIGRSAKGLP